MKHWSLSQLLTYLVSKFIKGCKNSVDNRIRIQIRLPSLYINKESVAQVSLFGTDVGESSKGLPVYINDKRVIGRYCRGLCVGEDTAYTVS